MNPEVHQTIHNERRYILPGLLLLLVVVGGYYYFRSQIVVAPNVSTEEPATSTVHVVRADEGEAKDIPTGFPTNIPIGKEITQSYRVDYTVDHLTQYTVGFLDTNTSKEIAKSYKSYMDEYGFKLTTSTTSYIEGVNGNNTLSVVISGANEGKHLVVVNLLVH